MKKLLVAYASKTGSTAEVAGVVAEELKGQDFEIVLASVNDVKSIKQYHGVILGTAIRMGKPIGEAMKFVKKYAEDLRSIPTVLFSLGIAMKEDTVANKEMAVSYLDPITDHLQPVNFAVFGGSLDFAKLTPILRFAFSRDTSGNLTEGDFRNWDDIRSWAKSLSQYFK